MLDFFDAIGARQLGEHRAQVRLGLELVRLRRFDKAVEIGARVRAGDRVAEEKASDH
jgi:hypothetical protein